MRTKKTVISIVVLTVLLSLLLVSPVAGTEESTTRTIKVWKYYDINGNGELDGEDGPKEGWLISVYAHDGADWYLLAQGTTGPDGWVIFDNLPPSTGDDYIVVEEKRECWTPSFPGVTEGYGGYYLVKHVPDATPRVVVLKNKYECGGDGCTLTPGYWKTHSEYGPAPYDSTWAMLPAGADTPFFSSGQSYYEALWTEPKGGNAYYILAHAWIAAQLNFLNGADPEDAQAAFAQAMVLLSAYDDSIPKKDPNRAIAIGLAEILDDYNNGIIGPGHCAE